MGGGNRTQTNVANLKAKNLKNPLAPTNIRNLEIANFNLSLPLDLDFDRELFFDLVDKDRANLPPNERLNRPYKYLINTPTYNVNSHDSIPPYSYFSGYYFLSPNDKHLDSAIRADFTLKTPLSPANANLKKRILQTQDSVFLHIRRGDYLNSDYANLCEGTYYDDSIKSIKSKFKKPHIFIFSNDILWCERNFLAILSDKAKKGVEFEFVKNNGEDSAVQEMELMRSCQNAIIANSTFSWWAGYLIDNPQKIVVMPNQFFVFSPKSPYDNTSQLFNGAILIDSHTGEIHRN